MPVTTHAAVQKSSAMTLNEAAVSRVKSPPPNPPPAETFQPAHTGRSWDSWIGISVSLVLHLSLLGGMAVMVAESTRNEVGTLSGVLGQPANELDGTLEFEAVSLTNPGGSETSPDHEVEHILEQLNASHERLLTQATLTGVGEGTGSGEGEGEDAIISVPAVSAPSYAVTKGSFSAWTVPEDPEPDQNYVIHILVRLPTKLQKETRFRLRDISGMVTGTDGYKKVIKFKSHEFAEVNDGTVQITVPVWGARIKKVRDTIRIESKLLHEKQIIRLEF